MAYGSSGVSDPVMVTKEDEGGLRGFVPFTYLWSVYALDLDTVCERASSLRLGTHVLSHNGSSDVSDPLDIAKE